MQMSYWRFAAMIATSIVAMFVLMYLNTFELDHVLWSQTRAWMAVLMGATMAAIMLGYMMGMYRNRKLNIAIFAGSVVAFALSLWLVRSQATIDDAAYMKAMVPHHSIAIMTSERAQITDPRVRKLADEIIASQRREIAEMKYLIDEIESGGGEVDAIDDARTPPRVVPAREAVARAEIAATDPGTLEEAEIERVLGAGPRCGFHYSRADGPVVSAAMPAGGNGIGKGVTKLHGRLVELTAKFATARPSPADGVVLSSDGIRIDVEPRGAARSGTGGGASVMEAKARLQLAAGLQRGYDGFYVCDAASR